jgi:hypothetical protein
MVARRREPPCRAVPELARLALGGGHRLDHGGAVGQDHRDVAGALADPEGAPLGAGTNALEGGAFIDEGLGDHEITCVHAVVVGCVRDSAREHLAHRLAGRLRREPQNVLGIASLHPTDEVDDPTCLHGRDADVPRLGPGFHRYPLARLLCIWLRWCLVDPRCLAALGLAVVLEVAFEGPGWCELAELVADHVLGDEHRDVLAAVVHGDRVAEHGRHDHRPAGPGLDDVL